MELVLGDIVEIYYSNRNFVSKETKIEKLDREMQIKSAVGYVVGYNEGGVFLSMAMGQAGDTVENTMCIYKDAIVKINVWKDGKEFLQ